MTNASPTIFYRSRWKQAVLLAVVAGLGIAFILIDLSPWLPDRSSQPYAGRITIVERFDAIRVWLGWGQIIFALAMLPRLIGRNPEIIVDRAGLSYPAVLARSLSWEEIAEITLTTMNRRPVLAVTLDSHVTPPFRPLAGWIMRLNKATGANGDFHIDTMRVEGSVQDIAKAIARYHPVEGSGATASTM